MMLFKFAMLVRLYVDLIIINVLLVFGRFERYQPVNLNFSRYSGAVLSGNALRNDLVRYEMISGFLKNSERKGLFVDFGTQFGYVPIQLHESYEICLGYEIDRPTALVAKLAVSLAELENVHICCRNVVHAMESLESFDSGAFLNIFHHVVWSINDPIAARKLILSSLSKCRSKVVLEVADWREGEYVWTDANKKLMGEKTAQVWFFELLDEAGFIVTETHVMENHLSSSRPLIFAIRR